jgi:hypothetical protein
MIEGENKDENGSILTASALVTSSQHSIVLGYLLHRILSHNGSLWQKKSPDGWTTVDKTLIVALNE